jgi:hypothetical protein
MREHARRPADHIKHAGVATPRKPLGPLSQRRSTRTNLHCGMEVNALPNRSYEQVSCGARPLPPQCEPHACGRCYIPAHLRSIRCGEHPARRGESQVHM